MINARRSVRRAGRGGSVQRPCEDAPVVYPSSTVLAPDCGRCMASGWFARPPLPTIVKHVMSTRLRRRTLFVNAPPTKMLRGGVATRCAGSCCHMGPEYTLGRTIGGSLGPACAFSLNRSVGSLGRGLLATGMARCVALVGWAPAPAWALERSCEEAVAE